MLTMKAEAGKTWEEQATGVTHEPTCFGEIHPHAMGVDCLRTSSIKHILLWYYARDRLHCEFDKTSGSEK